MPSDHQSSAAGARSREDRSKESTILLRKLGSSGAPTYLERVIQEDGAAAFVVVERVPRGAMTDEEVAECVRDARLAASLEHPNVVHTRAVRVGADEIDVVSDYVAGERLSEVWTASSGSTKGLPFDIALHVLIDVATGLGALHKLRSEENHGRVKYVHGEVTPANVLVGLDGVSAILRAARVRKNDGAPTVRPGAVAPEILSGGPVDQRADIYAVGALLWELISGQPPSPTEDIDAMLANARRGTVARAIMRAAPWALPLGEVAARALDPAAEKRFPTAASMVTELRKIAGQRLATTEQVAKFVEAAAGEKIAARLQDVQASAVIRKATSITPPRSVAPKTSGAPLAAPPSLRAASSVAPTRQDLPKVEEPPASAPEPPTLARPQMPTAPAAVAIAPLPPPVPPPVRSVPAPSPPPPPKKAPPVAAPKRAPAPPPRVAVSNVTATLRTRLAQSSILRLLAVALVLAVITAVLAWRAIRNRQPIVTPGPAMEMPTSAPPVAKVAVTPPAPAAPTAPPPVAAAPPVPPAPAAPPRAEPTTPSSVPATSKATVTKATEQRKTTSTKQRRK